MSFIVAIDGPAGSGKGTVTKKIAEEMDFLNLDTGATYRCVALATINRGYSINEEEKIIKMLDEINIDIKHNKGTNIILLDGEDVSRRIRENDVTNLVSPVSSIVEVRKKMVELQRKLAQGKNVIIEGRDIGTVVFPNADLKIYLDSNEEERAKRRYKENIEKGIASTYEEVLESIRKRDYNDIHKKVGPLKKADDAIVVDSTYMTIDETVKVIKTYILEKNPEM